MPAEPRRAVGPVVAWAAAALAAVAVASWGVAIVGRSVTQSRPAPLSIGQVEERLAAASATTTTIADVAPGMDTATAPPDPGSPTTTAAVPSVPSTSPVVAGGTDPGPTRTTAPAAPTTTAAPPAPAPTGETRTYALVGGTVSLRFEPNGVTVAFANPAAGFEVDVEAEHANGVRVEFESETHRSRVTGWWDGGPRDEVDEQGETEDD